MYNVPWIMNMPFSNVPQWKIWRCVIMNLTLPQRRCAPRPPLSKGSDSPRNIVQSVIPMQGPETFRRNWRLFDIFPVLTARSAIPGISPGRGYWFRSAIYTRGKESISEVWSSSNIVGVWLWSNGWTSYWSQEKSGLSWKWRTLIGQI